MQLDVNDLAVRDLYQWMTRLITPRPIAWVSTVSIDGVANLAPFSFFNGVGANPPTLMFCPANRRDGSPKDTLANIRRTGHFVVNLVTESLTASMNQTAAELDPDDDEFVIADVEKMESTWVASPRVADAAAALECELHSVVTLGTGPGGANLVIGRILGIHVDDRVVADDGFPDPALLDTIGRMGGNGYVRTTDRFEVKRPAPKR
ncbi:Flavin reductase like domain protein [Rubripirellula lacrimiformis]|uniref:Flavin reductase like domain protein n=1 Tax=Rubripirellula lacrimiformis TaxID=1930273 RepID=A0A517NDS9_9BACT|nr:flavin reductase family protein [Rubripirellula lacrimiformis]QDT05287.1 Flavin reductase like domain protein [Rubripirellula lacrimiformis]